MSFTLPPHDAARLREFLKLADEKVSILLTALSEAPPEFNYNDLTAKVFASANNISIEVIQGIILVLVSLYRTVDKREVPVAEFLDKDAFPSFSEAGVFTSDAKDSEWIKLRSFLLAALSEERSVGTAAKAGPVQTDHDHVFTGARILTDLRPIYHLNLAETPSAATVVHMLKITHRDHYQRHFDSYFALDSNDLEAMKGIIERAQKKEETLRNVISKTGVTLLAAGYFY
jgi:hypothetical protein